MPQSRQLAAIMFTDIVGYTALMGRDEQKAFELLNKNRQIQKPIIEQYNGRWIKELGDGVMASFNTVSDAVNAAIKIQQTCNASKDFKLCIGIHLGEVVFENDDVFGDGVNIAARIQALAAPGGIWVSEPVHNNVSNKIDIGTEYIKTANLKNVKEPVRIYQVKVEGVEATIPEKPVTSITENSIAVLPFANMSSDPEQEYFSDGISEEIINMLSQVPGLKVAGRTSSFSFKGKNQDLRLIGEQLSVNHILEGSVRKAGNKLRITAQLIKVADGYHLYSEKFDRELEDIFDIQDEISLAILNAIKIKLFEDEKEAVLRRYTNNTEAYQLYLQGRFYSAKWAGSDRYKKTIECYNESIKKEPDYVLAYTGLAACYLNLWFFGYMPPEQTLPKMKEATLRSLALDNTISETHVALARMHLWYEWNFKEAEKEFSKAIELNPNNSEAHEQFGFLFSILGKKNEALEQVEKAISLDPFSNMINWGLGWVNLFIGDFNRSSDQGKRLIELEPNFFGGYFMLGISLLFMGRYNDALVHLKIAAEQNPGSFIQFHIGLVFGLSGEKEKAKNILNGLLNMSKSQPVGNYDLAMIYASLGENDLAIQYLEDGFQKHEGMMVALRHYSHLIPGFKSDPRLVNLLERIGLPLK